MKYIFDKKKKIQKGRERKRVRFFSQASNLRFEGDIPPNTTKLIFGFGYDKKIDIGALPNTLTHLTFDGFNQKIDIGSLPNTLTHLDFGWNYNQKIDIGALPNTLTHLDFGRNFNQKLDIGVLPNTLTHLDFGSDFNQKLDIGALPDSLVQLTFGPKYNQKIDMGVLQACHNLNEINFTSIGVSPNSSEKITYANIDIVRNYKAIPYNTKIYIKRVYFFVLGKDDITDHVHILKIIDDILPMPIAEEIIPNIELMIEE